MRQHLQQAARSADQEAGVVIALFQLGYRNQLPGMLISCAVLLLLALGYGAGLPQPLLWWWLAWMAGVELIGMLNRGLAWRGERAGQPALALARRWRAIYLCQLMLGGLGWGNLGLLYVDGSALNAILLVVFFGMASLGSNLAAAHHYRAMLCAMPPAILLQVAYLPAGFGALAPPLQGMMLVYLLLLIVSGRNIHRNVLQNIHLRFDIEVNLRRTTQEAARADQANADKSRFLAAASHDLRQPVHALLLLVAAMRQRCREAAQIELIEHIEQAGQAIVRLFNGLMELSRLETGAEVAQLQAIAAADLLGESITRHLPEARQKNLRLRCVVSKNLARCCLHSDRLLLGRVLDNLIGNALRYTRRGGVLVSLRSGPGGALWLDVRDTGIGIAAGDVERIFSPYVQVGNSERDRSKGLGLGLAIVRRICALLGCPLTLHSALGRGSRFRLDLRAMRAADLPAQAPTVPRAREAPDLKGKNILVIDDDLMVQHAMATILSAWHAEVRSATRVEDIARLLDAAEWRPDVIVCDYRLPGDLTGIDLLNRLSERFPHALSILQTGELDPAVHEKAADAGYLLLKKPVDPEVLGATLAGCLTPASAPARVPSTTAVNSVPVQSCAS